MNVFVAFALFLPLAIAAFFMRLKSKPKTQQLVLLVTTGATFFLALSIFLFQPQLVPFLDATGGSSGGLIGLGTTAYAAFCFLTVLLFSVSLQFRHEALLLLAVEVSTLLALMTDSLFVFGLASVFAAVPIYFDFVVLREKGAAKLFLFFQVLGILLLGLAFLSLYSDLSPVGQKHFFSIHQLSAYTLKTNVSLLTSLLFAAALLVRIGVFPFHPQFLVVLQKSRFSGMIVFIMSHLMITSVLKFGGAWLPYLLQPIREQLLSLLILSAAYFSLVSLFQSNLRKLMAYQFLSFLNLGFTVFVSSLEKNASSGSIELLSICSVFSGLFGILWIVKTHMGVEDIKKYQGLAAKSSELATFFLLFALTCAGLPGTAGYIAEEVMLQQSFHDSMWRGILLLLTMGVNAWVMFRCFARLFLGPAPKYRAIISTTKREKIALLFLVAFLFIQGFLPDVMLH